MRKALQTLVKMKKIAETCGFWSVCLRFINTFRYIIDSKRVLLDISMSSALFYCVNCLYVCPYIKAPLAYALSKYNFSAIILKRGQKYALAFFLGAKS